MGMVWNSSEQPTCDGVTAPAGYYLMMAIVMMNQTSALLDGKMYLLLDVRRNDQDCDDELDCSDSDCAASSECGEMSFGWY